MTGFVDTLILIRKQSLAALQALEGVHWQKADGEVQTALDNPAFGKNQ